jgi:antitoxin (DNA-binding transcriptional repressor) of toxin-antitoxin stability system
MTATVEQTQSDLARLIRLAIEGEEIVITDSGLAIAKIVGLHAKESAPDRKKWLESLRELRNSTNTGKPGKSSDEILAEDRADRI